MDFFLGTTNPYKVREFASLMAATGCRLTVTEPVDPEETENTFEANARLKARAYARHAGGVTICEDSGLIVAARGGLPGPWSARFSDYDRVDTASGRLSGYRPSGLPRDEIDRRNNARVLELLAGVEQPRRAATFKAALVVAEPAGEILFQSIGESHGWIAEAAAGEGGFGYDPIFVGQDTFGRTYAELDSHRKNLRSHRRRVMQEFKMWLGQCLKRAASGETDPWRPSLGAAPRLRVVVDGNDGTGKTTLVEALRRRGYEVADRGLPTRMTDAPALPPADDEFYLLLDAPVEVCRARLAQAGRNLEERYHTAADLAHYRRRFLEVAATLPRHALLDAARTPDEVLADALLALERAGVRP